MAQVTELASTQDADRMIQASYERPVYLLKHSISCPVSGRGHRQFAGLVEDEILDTYAVIVQDARDVSNYLAETLGVRHETPQAILIKDGKAVSVTSHFAIKTKALRKAAEQAGQNPESPIIKAGFHEKIKQIGPQHYQQVIVVVRYCVVTDNRGQAQRHHSQNREPQVTKQSH